MFKSEKVGTIFKDGLLYNVNMKNKLEVDTW